MSSKAKKDRQKEVSALLRLSHELGREDRRMAILGEGNTSASLGPDTFLIKASGSSLGSMEKTDIVECRAGALLALMNRNSASDEEITGALLSSRVDSKSRKPSVEALFHAFCLSLPGVEYVGHTHPVAVNQVLCSPQARAYAGKRIFPDEIVCCGSASVFVPYTDPGFRLSQEIRRRTNSFIKRHGQTPRVILIQNHGIVTLGKTPQAVLAAMLMAEKAASIWAGAAALGGPSFLSEHDVERIANRLDEHYRQKALRL